MRAKATKIPPVPPICPCLKMQERLSYLRTLPPNPKFHNFNTIKWLRRCQNKESLKESVNSLVESSRKERPRSSNLPLKRPHAILNPKYFYSKETFDKILKLRKLFLDYDRDKSRKINLKVIESLFNINSIQASSNELSKLIFKNKKTDSMSFDEFISISIEKDIDFRVFMQKIMKKDKNFSQKKYFPMNFDNLLDYFIAKGEERKSMNKIAEAIYSISYLLKENKDLVQDVNEFVNTNKKINVNEIFNEFLKLFKMAQINCLESEVEEKENQKKNERERKKIEMLNCKGVFTNVLREDIHQGSNQKKKKAIPKGNGTRLPKINMENNIQVLINKKIEHYRNCVYDQSKRSKSVSK